MLGFAAFGFPKSHAVAFALLAYESAWLRHYYPAEYYARCSTAQPMGFYSVEALTGDAQRHGIAVLPPSINTSRAKSWPEDGNIRLGLEQVKGLGGGWQHNRGKREPSLPQRIEAERRTNGAYRSLYDLVTRTQLNREQAEALISAGALEDFGLPRREMLWQLGLITSRRRQRQLRHAPFSLPCPSLSSMTWSNFHASRPGSHWRGITSEQARARTTRCRLCARCSTRDSSRACTLAGCTNDNRLPNGMVLEMAGMVVTRQRPATASGVMFMLLEMSSGLPTWWFTRQCRSANASLCAQHRSS